MDLKGKIEPVCEFEGSWEPMWYMTRQHVDRSAFIDELKREFGDECESYCVEDVEHGYMRLVPVGADRPGEMCYMLAEKGRGAFPVTFIDALFPASLRWADVLS